MKSLESMNEQKKVLIQEEWAKLRKPDGSLTKKDERKDLCKRYSLTETAKTPFRTNFPICSYVKFASEWEIW